MSDLYTEFASSMGLSYRNEQHEVYQNLVSASEFPGAVTLIQAETGIGKAFATALAAVTYLIDANQDTPRKVVIATSTVALMRDLESYFIKLRPLLDNLDFYPYVSLLFGKGHFVSPERVRAHMSDEWADSDINLAEALMNWSETIDDFIAEFGSLPAALVADDVCQTDYYQRDNWQEERDTVLASDVVISTHAMIGADMRRNIFSDDEIYLIVDEGDAFVDHLESREFVNFNIRREFSGMEHHFTQKGEKLFCELKERCNQLFPSNAEFSIHEMAMAKDVFASLNLAVNYVKRNISDAERNWFGEMRSYISYMSENIEANKYVGCGKTDVLKEPSITVLNPYFSRVFGSYSEKFNAVTLMSGTLSVGRNIIDGTAWVVKKLGLGNRVVRTAEVSPVQFGDLKLYLCPPADLMYDAQKRLSAGWISNIALAVEKMPGKTLLITSSHDETEMLGAHITNSAYQKKGEKLSVAMNRFAESGAACFITAAGHTGVNFTNSSGRSMLNNIVITRLGFPAPSIQIKLLSGLKSMTSEHKAALRLNEYFDSLNSVIRRTRQIIGRGIRSSDDKISLYIFDSRFPKPSEFTSRYSLLRNAIPKRFQSSYVNFSPLLDSVGEKGINEQEFVI